MADRNDGGPAFPRPVSTDEHDKLCNVFADQEGMSFRDWLAGRAMPAVLAATAAGQHDAGAVNLPEGSIEQRIAADAYALADAMLAARDGGAS